MERENLSVPFYHSTGKIFFLARSPDAPSTTLFCEWRPLRHGLTVSSVVCALMTQFSILNSRHMLGAQNRRIFDKTRWMSKLQSDFRGLGGIIGQAVECFLRGLRLAEHPRAPRLIRIGALLHLSQLKHKMLIYKRLDMCLLLYRYLKDRYVFIFIYIYPLEGADKES